MARAYVSIGTNIEPRSNLARALRMLRERFGELETSPVYEADAVGFEGPAFLNMVAAFDTRLGPAALVRALREVEDACGRDRSRPRFSSRPMDIDLLLLGDRCDCSEGVELPRPEILKEAFVLVPLADLAPDEVHPGCGRSYAELLRAMVVPPGSIRRVAEVAPAQGEGTGARPVPEPGLAKVPPARAGMARAGGGSVS